MSRVLGELRTGAAPLKAGEAFPDLDLPDHTGRARRLSELGGGDPVALFTSRGWWCPKEQRYMRELCHLQDEFEVAYTRLVVVSVDPRRCRPRSGPVSVPASPSCPTQSGVGSPASG